MSTGKLQHRGSLFCFASCLMMLWASPVASQPFNYSQVAFGRYLEDNDNSTEVIITANEKEVHVLDSNEQEALRLLYDKTEMESSDKNDWFRSEHELEDGTIDFCSFKGVECKSLGENDQDKENFDENTAATTSVVVKLNLKDKGLEGKLPRAALAALPHLTHLNLAYNNLRGSIPLSLATLGELRDLDLSRNKFSGPFPSLDSRADVKKILLRHNRLEGSLPAESLCPFRRLKVLDISGNEAMHGTIPDCLEDFDDLETLKFDEVGLTGDIPPSLCSSNRKMNGFDPDEGFGCDAIACPMGTFEPTVGRQRDGSTPCQPCPYWEDDDPLALLLGSTTCPDPPTLPPTESPTLSPTLQPTLWMAATAQPTQAQTSTATSSTTGGVTYTQAPTSTSRLEPTQETDTSTSTSPVPSSSEMIPSPVWLTERLIVEVMLLDVHRTLDSIEEIAAVEDLALEFLRAHEEEGALDILDLTISSQRIAPDKGRDQVSMIDSRELLAISHVPVIPPEKRNQIALPNSHTFWSLRSSSPGLSGEDQATAQRNRESIPSLPDSRALQTGRAVLTMTMEIALSFPSTLISTKPALVAAWGQNMPAFLALLRESSALTGLFEGEDEDILPGTNDLSGLGGGQPSSAEQWTLLRIALIVSSLALLSAAVLAFTRWRYYHRNMGYKRQEDVAPQQTRSDSSITSTNKSENKLGETSSNPEDDMLREALDARSAFSCWKQWDTIKGVVSEESDSGWNSGSGSGSVPDSHLHGGAKSIGGVSTMLDPYITDVWSVAPDHRLCFSNSNRGSDEDDEEGISEIPMRLISEIPTPRRINSADSIIAIATSETSLKQQNSA